MFPSPRQIPTPKLKNINRRGFLKYLALTTATLILPSIVDSKQSANAKAQSQIPKNINEVAQNINQKMLAMLRELGIEAKAQERVAFNLALQGERTLQWAHTYLGPNSLAYLTNNINTKETELKIQLESGQFTTITKDDLELPEGFNITSSRDKDNHGFENLGSLSFDDQKITIIAILSTPPSEKETDKTIQILAVDTKTGQLQKLYQIDNTERISYTSDTDGQTVLLTTYKYSQNSYGQDAAEQQDHIWNKDTKKFTPQETKVTAITEESRYLSFTRYLSKSDSYPMPENIVLNIETGYKTTKINITGKNFSQQINIANGGQFTQVEGGFVILYKGDGKNKDGGVVERYLFNPVTNKFEVNILLRSSNESYITKIEHIEGDVYATLEGTDSGLNSKVSIVDTTTTPHTKTIIEGIPAGFYDMIYDATAEKLMITGPSHTGPTIVRLIDPKNPNTPLGGKIIYTREWKGISHSVAEQVALNIGKIAPDTRLSTDQIPYLEVGGRNELQTRDEVSKVKIAVYGGYRLSAVNVVGVELDTLQSLYNDPTERYTIFEIAGGGTRSEVGQGDPTTHFREIISSVLATNAKYPNARIDIYGASKGGYNVLGTLFYAIKQAAISNDPNNPYLRFLQITNSVYGGVPVVDLEAGEHDGTAVEMGFATTDSANRKKFSLYTLLDRESIKLLKDKGVVLPIIYLTGSKADERTPIGPIIKLYDILIDQNMKVYATIGSGSHLGSQNPELAREENKQLTQLSVLQENLVKSEN